MREPWPSTQSRSPRFAPSTTSRSPAPATKSATTASTAIPQPAIALPARPAGRQLPAGGGPADDRRRRPEAERVGDAPYDRDPLVRLARPRGVEDRDGRVRRVADNAAHRLAVVRGRGGALRGGGAGADRGRAP